MKWNTTTILFWLGIAGVIASAVADQFGVNTHAGLIASTIVASLAKVRAFVQAYATPDAPTADKQTVNKT